MSLPNDHAGRVDKYLERRLWLVLVYYPSAVWEKLRKTIQGHSVARLTFDNVRHLAATNTRSE